MADNLAIKDGNGANAQVKTKDVGSDVHVPFHALATDSGAPVTPANPLPTNREYLDIADTTGAITASGQRVFLNVAKLPAAVVTLQAAAVAGCNIAFEFSNDSTNGSDGNWYQMMGMRTNSPELYDQTTGVLGAAPAYGWLFCLTGYSWMRLRCTAFTSGTMNVRISPTADGVVPQFRTPATQTVSVSGTPAVTVSGGVTGAVAHDSPVSGAPVRIGAKAVAVMPAAVSAANDVADVLTTMQGVAITTLDSVGAGKARASLALTLTSDVSVFAAAGAGLCNYLTDMQMINTGASAVDLIIKDGTTAIATYPLPPNVPVNINGLRSPLRSAANAAINVALSAAGTVRLNAQGFIAA